MDVLSIMLVFIFGNIVVDYLVFREVRRMRGRYDEVLLKTADVEVSIRSMSKETTEFKEQFEHVATQMPDLLESHAKAITKGISGVIGYYQGKALQGEGENMEKMREVLGDLAPIMDLMKSSPVGLSSDNGGNPKFHV